MKPLFLSIFFSILSSACLSGQSVLPISIKTQIPGLGIYVASPLIKSLGGEKPVAPFVSLELEKGIGTANSLLAFISIRKGRDEGEPIIGFGTPFWEADGWKSGFGFRHYFSPPSPLEGLYIQPMAQAWRGKFLNFTGDTFESTERFGVSLVIHGGYQCILGRGFTLDGSLGLGLGFEDVSGTQEDRFTGLHYLHGTRGGWGLGGDLRLGVGWRFK